jgi:nucleoside recognition membrane protein YjiH
MPITVQSAGENYVITPAPASPFGVPPASINQWMLVSHDFRTLMRRFRRYRHIITLVLFFVIGLFCTIWPAIRGQESIDYGEYGSRATHITISRNFVDTERSKIQELMQ